MRSQEVADVPESKKRKKAVYVPPPASSKKKGPSPVWVPALMLALMLIGVAWLVAFYIGGSDLPLIGGLNNYNLLIGFGFIVAGFALSTQWR